MTGNWIGDYAYSAENNEIRIIKPIRRILTFDNGVCSAKGSKYDYGTETEKGEYNLILKTLEFDGEFENYDIEIFTSDSLVLINKANSFRYVYRKLSDSLKHNSDIEFIGKEFKWENNKFTDTLYFKNETFLKRKSQKFNNGEVSWERIKHNGFDIIFIDGDVPYLIKGQNGKTINLISYHKTELKHTMIELE
jgi:hypothetical protein